MQKRSKRFALIGVAALALCLAAAMFLITGCSSEPEKEESPAVLAPQDKEPTDSTPASTPTEPFYVLIVGNDSRQGTAQAADGAVYSDTIMLTRVDPVNYKVTTVSIPRDTETWMDGQVYKINDAYEQGGVEKLAQEVENLTGVHADYYFEMGFAQFINFINTLGGVDVYVPVPMTFADVMTNNDISLEEGDQHLNGNEALVYSRVRKIYYEAGEACRQINDRRVVAAALQYVANNPDVIPGAVSALYDNVASTNWDRAQFEALVQDFAAHSDQFQVLGGTGPYEGGIEESSGIWVAWRDEDTYHAIIDLVNQGGDPNEIVTPPEQILE